MLAAALLVGVLIGCVGIGGVLLTPALVYVGGLGFHLAAATSMGAFLFAGASGTLIYSRRGSVDWRMAAWLGAGVVPTAFAGAWANVALLEGMLMALLAALMVVTGATGSSTAARSRVGPSHYRAPDRGADGMVVNNQANRTVAMRFPGMYFVANKQRGAKLPHEPRRKPELRGGRPESPGPRARRPVHSP
jgi:uncharacterized membrane protein YfcA